MSLSLARSFSPARSLRAAGVLLACAYCAALAGQSPQPSSPQQSSPPNPLPRFEVASIRLWQPPPPPPAPPGEQIIHSMVQKVAPASVAGAQTTDRVHLIGQTAILLEMAFELPLSSSSRIVGAPSWVSSESDRYDIQARIDPADFARMQSLPPAEQHYQVALMEQALLRDRFHLQAHFEQRPLPVYLLTLAREGPRLAPAASSNAGRIESVSSDRGIELRGAGVTLAQFVQSPLLRPDGRPVIDRTGLSGAFDFTLRYSPAQADPAAPSAWPGLFTAIREQLGLRLTPATQPLDVLVIDHIDRPSEN